ncbi:RAMP superfamily CRISPR-associated protein [Numidum massiliense]|uniref:RAMP superfamily CRISPR-associated protein n=1 Tax=Numidum massiliense TaxID=1522315 RepID=UPI0006D52CC7|nr:RAMP superfamily CRISPR-associated protein [Numidum massiliense]
MNLALYEEGTALRTIDYTVSLVTPMAVHGADNRQMAEWRHSSFKGILRYWWRTLQFGKNKRGLILEEEELFGGTNGSDGESGKKSPITFMSTQQYTSRQKAIILPHKGKGKVPAVEQGHTVTFTLALAKRVPIDTVMQYKKIVNYTLLLASVGQRARRGFGAIQGQEHQFATIDNFRQTLYAALDDLGASYERQTSNTCLLRTAAGEDALDKRHDTLRTGGQVQVRQPYRPTTAAKMSEHPTLAAVWLGSGEKDAYAVLKKIGDASHRANGRGQSLGSAMGGRFASPLWCTVRKIGNLYYPVVNELHSQKVMSNWQRYQSDRDLFLRILGVDV